MPQFGELVQDSRDDRLHHCELTKQKTSVMYGPCWTKAGFYKLGQGTITYYFSAFFSTSDKIFFFDGINHVISVSLYIVEYLSKPRVSSIVKKRNDHSGLIGNCEIIFSDRKNTSSAKIWHNLIVLFTVHWKSQEWGKNLRGVAGIKSVGAINNAKINAKILCREWPYGYD